MAAPPVIARTVTYHHARVGRTELDKLFLVAGESAGAGTVSVKCTVGSAHLQEDTLDDLIAARSALPHVSDRTPWTALTLERDEGAVRYTSVEFGDGLVTVTARSGDPIWTHGQTHRLGEILEEVHGATAPGQYRQRMIMLAVMIPMLGVSGGLILSLPSYAQDDAPIAFSRYAILAMGAYTLGMLVREWLRQRSRRAVLKVTSEVEWGSTWSRLTSTDRIAVVSAVIAGLTLVATAAALI
jgi:hypothetical protein